MFAMTPRALWKGMFLALGMVAVLAVFLVLSIPPQAAGQSGTPARPTGVSVSVEDGSLEVSIDWNDVSGATSYVVRWREHGAGNDLNTGITVDDSNATITVDDAGEWVVRVQACNANGCGRGAAKRFTVTAAEPEPTPTPEPEPTATPTPAPLRTHSLELVTDSMLTIPGTIRNGVLEWDQLGSTASSGFHLTLKSSRDYLRRQTGGNGNYFVRIERASGSAPEMSITPTCVEFPAGGGASTGTRLYFSTQGYYSYQGKSAEFLVYETTGETGCTNVRETADPKLTPGKIVLTAPPHPPVTLPNRIEITEGETRDTTGLPALAPDFDNRVKVRVTRLGDADVTLSPSEFWVEHGTYDLTRWPNLQITARPDADTASDHAWFDLYLTHRGQYLTSAMLEVRAHDRNTGIRFQNVGAAANFTGSVTVQEGQQRTFRVRPAAPPTDGNTVEIHTSLSGGSGLQLTAPSLVYDQDDWDQWRTITLGAATDANNADEQYTVTLWTTSAGDAAYNRGSSFYFGGSGATQRDWTINVTVSEEPTFQTSFVSHRNATIRNGVTEWDPITMTASSGTNRPWIAAADDDLPRNPGGNGNYYVRIERTSVSASEITITPSCLEFAPGGGASARRGIGISVGLFYSFQGKSAEFMVYETTGETGCTNVQETANPVFAPGKMVVNALPHPPLTMPNRIDLVEGETYNTSDLSTVATNPINRARVRIVVLDDGVTVSPREFFIPPGSYDIAQWPNVQITAQRDADTDDEQPVVVFYLQGSVSTYDGFAVYVQDRNPGIEFQHIAAANFTGSAAVPEGQQRTFRVRPAAPPTDGNTLEIRTSVSGGSGLQLTAPSLVYDQDDWDEWRTVTLDAATDANDVDEQYAVTLWTTSAGDAAYNRGSSTYFGGSGANQTDWTVNVTVSEGTPAPQSYPGIAVEATGLAAYVKPSPNLKDADRQLEITDGESVDLRVRLTQAPDANLTLSSFLGRLHSSETRLENVTITPGRLTFTPSNWDTWQTMTVSAEAGAGERGMIYLDARVSSGDPDYAPSQDVSFDIALFRSAAPVPAPEPTPEPTPGIAVEATGLEAYVKRAANHKDGDGQLEMSNGDSVTLRVRLTQAPDAQLRLTANVAKIRAHSSETRLEGVTISPSVLNFTANNWDQWQTMTVSMAAGAGERGMIHLDARVASGDPDYAPSQDVSFDIALFRAGS